jgi:hypothetical protein
MRYDNTTIYIYFYIYCSEITYQIKIEFYRIELISNKLDKIRRTLIRESNWNIQSVQFCRTSIREFSLNIYSKFDFMIRLMHFITDALSRSWLIIFWFWENRECWFFRLRLRLKLILKSCYISMFDRFQFFSDSVFVFSSRIIEMNVSQNCTFLQNSIVAERWSSFLICSQKFLNKHRFEIEEISNTQSIDSSSESFSFDYSRFDLILERWLFQNLKNFMNLFLYLIIDFLVSDD